MIQSGCLAKFVSVTCDLKLQQVYNLQNKVKKGLNTSFIGRGRK